MQKFTLVIELKSDTLPGSGEGFGAVIDQDVVFDELGLPWIPAKRIKGLLRESYEEIYELLNGKTSLPDSNSIFGKPGQEVEAPLYISNLYLEDYENLKKDLSQIESKFPSVFSTEAVLSQFTYTRQQTAIDSKSGTAAAHSLRTIRVIKKGLVFKGEITYSGNISNFQHILAIACLNLRRIGSKRTRGFGEIDCHLKDGKGAGLSEDALSWLKNIDNKSNPVQSETPNNNG